MSSAAQRTNLYLQFKEVGGQSFRSVVQFWERHEQDINGLDLPNYFDLLNEYARALFELGKYNSFLEVAEDILELAFEYNIQEWDDKDVVQHTLLKKAAAHFHLYEHQQAQNMLEQLLRLQPDHKTARLLLERCLYRSQRTEDQKWRSLTVLLMLSSALLVAGELIVVRPFFPDWASVIEWSRNGLFILALFVWTGGELYQRFHIKKRCQTLIRNL